MAPRSSAGGSSGGLGKRRRSRKQAAVCASGGGEPIFQDFHWTETDEPHSSRRKLILRDHPELRELFTGEPLTCPIVLGIVAVQLFMASWAQHASWLAFFGAAWLVGGVLNHAMSMAIHELSHDLCFSSTLVNQALGLFGSLITGVPSASTFKRYHMEHHQFQGVDAVDTDVPSIFEVNFIRNLTLRKLIFVIFQPIFYATRPMYCRPKPLRRWEHFCLLSQFVFDLVILWRFGFWSLLYLYVSTWLGLGLHIVAGHFIAEHYELIRGQETYSYYGPVNYLTLNVGYHVEHHDFPRVPWSKLPKVREMAPEYYENMPHYTSYLKVLCQFITDPELGPFSRIKRPNVRKQVD